MIRTLESSVSSLIGQGTKEPSSIMSVSFTDIDCFLILSTAVNSDSQWLKHGIIAEMEGGFIEFKPSLEDLFTVQVYSV